MYDSVLGWKDGLAIKSICCFCRGPSQFPVPHGGSQPSITPVAGGLMPSHFCRHQAHL